MRESSISNVRNVPRHPTAFIGRKRELAEIADLICKPACRLVTLVGVGGVGKTRLAIQLAANLVDSFTDGVVFVPINQIESEDYLWIAINDALETFQVSGPNLKDQVISRFEDKNLLLILDNFDYVLDAGIGIADLLFAHDGIKLLVTSRQVLNLQDEWVYHVHGVDFPDTNFLDDLETFDAVKLFVERAQRVRWDFSLDQEAQPVLEICNLVDGIPLALELAASWVKMMSCRAIANEIRDNVQFLETRMRDMPERHRSIQAVFEQSWKLLDTDQRSLFSRLSVFRGGFHSTAAIHVANASLPLLSSLVDHSMLTWSSDNRYHMHEILRQFAEFKLAEDAEGENLTRMQHAKFYLDFMKMRWGRLQAGEMTDTMQEIDFELDNVRTAWAHISQLADISSINEYVDAFVNYLDLRGRYLECVDIIEKALSTREKQDDQLAQETYAKLLVHRGNNFIRLGKFTESQESFNQSQGILALYELQPQRKFATDPYIGSAFLQHVMGNYSDAIRLSELELKRVIRCEDKNNLMMLYYTLSSARFALGEYQAAILDTHEAYRLTFDTNHRWFRGYVLINMGNLALAQGDYAVAQQHFRDSLIIKDEFNDPEGMAVALTHLGQTSLYQGDNEEAESYYRQAWELYQELGDLGGLANSRFGLGYALVAGGYIKTGSEYLRHALKIAVGMRWTPMVLLSMVGIGELIDILGDPLRAVATLSMVVNHPSGEQITRDLAMKRLSESQKDFGSDESMKAYSEGKYVDLYLYAEQLLSDKQLWARAAQVGESVELGFPAEIHSPLIDPLTAREQEVLELISIGLTNPQIAEQLIISVGTVKSYTGQIYSKLQVNNRTQAVAQARELGLLP